MRWLMCASYVRLFALGCLTAGGYIMQVNVAPHLLDVLQLRSVQLFHLHKLTVGPTPVFLPVAQPCNRLINPHPRWLGLRRIICSVTFAQRPCGIRETHRGYLSSANIFRQREREREKRWCGIHPCPLSAFCLHWQICRSLVNRLFKRTVYWRFNALISETLNFSVSTSAVSVKGSEPHTAAAAG